MGKVTNICELELW